MSNQIIDPLSELHTVGTKRSSDTLDAFFKKQKSSLDVLKLGKPGDRVRRHRNDAFHDRMCVQDAETMI